MITLFLVILLRITTPIDYELKYARDYYIELDIILLNFRLC